jgi:hypothetical protein
MAVPRKDDEGLLGDPVRGVINFEGETIDDALKALSQAFDQIADDRTLGTNYLRDEADTREVGFYSFEVELKS